MNLKLAEYVVYLQLVERATHGVCRIRYEELARAANISRSTMKRVVHSLRSKGLIETSWHHKTPMEFRLTAVMREEPPSGFLRRLEEEDRALLLTIKRSLAPTDMQELQKDALSRGEELDVLIFQRFFGAEKRKRRLDGVLSSS